MQPVSFIVASILAVFAVLTCCNTPVVQQSTKTGSVVACATEETGWKMVPAHTGQCDDIETAEVEWVP